MKNTKRLIIEIDINVEDGWSDEVTSGVLKEASQFAKNDVFELLMDNQDILANGHACVVTIIDNDEVS